jgi:hypothetical protein
MDYMGEIDVSLEEASKISGGDVDEVCYACMDLFMSCRYFYIHMVTRNNFFLSKFSTEYTHIF